MSTGCVVIEDAIVPAVVCAFVDNAVVRDAVRSKYCFRPEDLPSAGFSLTVCAFALPLNTLKTCLYRMLCGYKKESGEPSGS